MSLSALPPKCAPWIQPLLITPSTSIQATIIPCLDTALLLPGLCVPHPPFSISNQRKCKTAKQTKLPSSFKPSHGFLLTDFGIKPKHLSSLLPQSGICLAPQSPFFTGIQPVHATGPLHWPGTFFSHIFPWLAPPLCVLRVLCLIGTPFDSYDTFQRTLT